MADSPASEMTDTVVKGGATTAGGSLAAMKSADAALDHIESLAAENEALSRDLLRCYEQLSLVFEITEHIAVLHDPRQVQEALLGRYAAMLGVAAIFVDHPGASLPEPLPVPGGAEIDIDPADIVKHLADEIEAVRSSRRAQVYLWQPTSGGARGSGTPAKAGRSREGSAASINILLDTLRQFDADAAVVIADNRCPRCCTRAFLRMWGYMKCLACSFEPKPFYYPLYVDPGAVMSTRRLNNLIDIWEREERFHLERERRKAAAHYERSQRVAEKARRLVVKARSDEVEFLRQCDRLAWHRQRLA
ncbi:MAG: hypothetical protein IIC56_05365, partial [Proteobacteria bacterium]|nr:hypothetical protein [Pseudomonadota bacterium]